MTWSYASINKIANFLMELELCFLSVKDIQTSWIAKIWINFEMLNYSKNIRIVVIPDVNFLSQIFLKYSYDDAWVLLPHGLVNLDPLLFLSTFNFYFANLVTFIELDIWLIIWLFTIATLILIECWNGHR